MFFFSGCLLIMSSTNHYFKRSTLKNHKKENLLHPPIIYSLVEEFKVSNARLTVITLKQSKDGKFRNAGIEVRTGRKWSASQAVQEAERYLKLKDVVGTTQVGRQGLGIIQDEIRSVLECEDDQFCQRRPTSSKQSKKHKFILDEAKRVGSVSQKTRRRNLHSHHPNNIETWHSLVLSVEKSKSHIDDWAKGSLGNTRN